PPTATGDSGTRDSTSRRPSARPAVRAVQGAVGIRVHRKVPAPSRDGNAGRFGGAHGGGPITSGHPGTPQPCRRDPGLLGGTAPVRRAPQSPASSPRRRTQALRRTAVTLLDAATPGR